MKTIYRMISRVAMAGALLFWAGGAQGADPKVKVAGESNAKAVTISDRSTGAMTGRIGSRLIDTHDPATHTTESQTEYPFDPAYPTVNPNNQGFFLQALGHNRLVLASDHYPGYEGLVVDETGNVGAGVSSKIDPMGAFQVGTVEAITFHDGGSGKWMLFNSYYDLADSTFKYMSNYDDFDGVAGYQRQNAPAAAFAMDDAANIFSLKIAQPGGKNAAASLLDVLTVNTAAGGGLGNIGVNFNKLPGGSDGTPGAALDICGKIEFRNTTTSAGGVGGYIWGDGGHVKIQNGSGTVSTLSPHDDPRTVDAAAQTSFADPTVALPFSMHHENSFVGKGEIVDISKMVQYVEKQMKKDLGEKAGQLVFEYDLAANQQKTTNEKEIEETLADLQSMPPVEVAVGSDGHVPAEAFQQVDETKTVSKMIKVQEKRLDPDSMSVVTTEVSKKVFVNVKTGRKVNRLKPGWQFDNGKLLRPATVDDLDLDALVKRHPQLPQWVLDRAGKNRQAGLPVSDLVLEIKSRVAKVSPEKVGEKEYQAASNLTWLTQ